MARAKKVIFLILCVVCVYTFFARHNIRSLRQVDPNIKNQPMQRKLYGAPKFQFEYDKFYYTVTPVYDYRISALVTSVTYYKAFSIYKYDSVFPVDLCLMWGTNVARELYKSPHLRFSQDCRWCWVEWDRNIGFNLNEFSNNHLLIKDKKIEKIARGLVAGDQVRISGKLVNVVAHPSGLPESTQNAITWKTSQKRNDRGAGACEVIFVENLEVLKRANSIERYGFLISLWGAILIVVVNLFHFFFTKY